MSHRGRDFVPVGHKGLESLSKHSTCRPKSKHVHNWRYANLNVQNRHFTYNTRVLPYGLQDGLSVFGCFQADLLTDDIGVLSLDAASCFRLGLDAQKLVLVPQPHLVLYRRCGRNDT